MAVGQFILPSGGGGSYSKVVQVYTSSGTWTKPAGLTHIEVICIGGGGGGAAGEKRAAGVVSRGGCGGTAASIAWGSFTESQLGATVNYTVGSGGAGGAIQLPNDQSGDSGQAGGDSFFDGTDFATSKVYAQGGTAGTNAAVGATRLSTGLKPAGLPGLVGGASSATGAAGSAGTAENTSTNFNLLRGGGGGGGITTLNVANAGGSGARYYNKAGTLSSSNAGSVGADGHMNRLPFNLGDGNYSGIAVGYGCPGGGGAANAIGNGGAGGNGGLYGGAGGGGGATRNDVGNSGKGGNGGAGVVIVIEHIVS